MIDALGCEVEMIPTLNTKLVVEIWDWLEFPKEDDPRWYQGSWMDQWQSYLPAADENSECTNMAEGYCGTSSCLAGRALMEETERDVTGDLRPMKEFTTPDGEVVPRADSNAYWCGDPAYPSWSVRGAKKLGITDDEAEALFFGGNTKEDIRRILNKILENRGEPIRL